MRENPQYTDYLAVEQLPHLWCDGCGNGVILKALTLALADLQLPKDKVLLASGIGCCGRMGDYVSTHRFQGTHGRTLASVTGVKMVRPELTVIAMMGDGDCGAIGGNHFLHAARRNLDVMTIVSNNFNYGMTGGQYSPVTPASSVSSTSRQGKTEPAMDLCSLAMVAGANWVAKTTVFHVVELRKMIVEGITKKGFRFLEIISPCPTYHGRYNGLGNSVEMLRWIKERTLPLAQYQALTPEDQENHFWRGRLVDRNLPDMLSRYRQGSGGAKE
ncbi:MAG: thiamine pyrophosphate-dependent enzyme [Bacillota bacterium]